MGTGIWCPMQQRFSHNAQACRDKSLHMLHPKRICQCSSRCCVHRVLPYPGLEDGTGRQDRGDQRQQRIANRQVPGSQQGSQVREDQAVFILDRE